MIVDLQDLWDLQHDTIYKVYSMYKIDKIFRIYKVYSIDRIFKIYTYLYLL